MIFLSKRTTVLMTVVLAAFLICILSPSITAEPSPSKQIPKHVQDVLIEITDSTAHLIETENWLIEVYAPWCGYCAKVFPLLVSVAEHVKAHPESFPNTKIALIDGTTNPILDKRFVTGGYPTLYNLKDGKSLPFGHQRTVDAFLQQLKVMARPPVEMITDRGHLQRLQGTNGYWQNIFIYLGGNLNQYREFQSCAETYQGVARFYSPYGYQDNQQIHLAQSLWLGHPENWEKHWEQVGIESKNSLLDLTDHFKLPFESLPTVVNQAVGRAAQIYSGAWDTGSAERMCVWVKALLTTPIESLSPLIFRSVTEASDVFLLMSIANESPSKLAQLAILPSISRTNAGLYDRLVWTTSNLVPRLKAHYKITADDFILCVNRHMTRYWVKTTEIDDEEAVLAWLKRMQTDPDFNGEPLYHWANFVTPLILGIAKWGERFTTDHLLFFLGLACASIVAGLLIGVLIITYCMEDVNTKIDRLKHEREVVEKLRAPPTSSPVEAKRESGPVTEGLTKRK